MADLKTLCIDGECRDIPEAGKIYTAGDNIDIINEVISLISSPALKGVPTTPNITDKSASTTQIANADFVQGAINRRLPKSINVDFDQLNVEVSNAAYKSVTLGSITGAGIVVGYLFVQFSANASGRRMVELMMGSTPTTGFSISPSPSGITTITVPVLYRQTATATWTARLYQASGASLTADVHARLYLIND